MKENDKVRIKKNNIIGIIIDIYEVGGTKHFSVESVERKVDVEGGYGGDFPIFDCVADEIELAEILGNKPEQEEELFMMCDDTVDIGKEPLPIISEDVRKLMEKHIKRLK